MIGNVIATSAPYWAAEYAVAFRYFTEHPRTRQSDLRWVRFQMVKEWAGGGVYGKDVTLHVLVGQIGRAMQAIETDGVIDGAPELAERLRFTAEEFNHYALLCEVHRKLAPGSRMSMAAMDELADGEPLKRVRNAVREEPQGELAVEFSEGGGLALFFAIRDAFARVGVRSELDAAIERFARNTLEDEQEHLRHRFRSLRDADLSEADWKRVESSLQAIWAVKLRERNRQFGAVFREEPLLEMGRDLAAGRRYVAAHLGFLGDDLPQQHP